MSLRDKLRLDFHRGAGAAALACASVAAVELILSLIVAESVSLLTIPRFAALTVTLVALAALVLVPLGGAGTAAVRLGRSLFDREAALRMRTLGDPGPGPAVASPAVPLFWALFLCSLAYVAGSFGLTMAFKRFREPIAVALGLAVCQLGLFAVLAIVTALITAGLRRASARLHPRLGAVNPLGRGLPAAGLLIVIAVSLIPLLLRELPLLRGVIPWRELTSLLVFAVGFVGGARLLAVRGRFWPRGPRRRRIARLATIVGFVVLAPLTLWKIGADDGTRYLANSASPTLSRLIQVVRRANDFDGDGFGTLLGENDCAPFDKNINPLARDIPDNGIDENCNGYDFSSKGLATRKRGERLALPPQYQRKYNVLLVSIDALRYDHTGMGGYLAARKRDTTPRIDALARRGVWFTFANAPSAGTMASIPSLLTSKFFHSGVATRSPPGFVAPIVLPENVTIPDVVKRAGYTTAGIVTHDYFGPKGMQLAGEFDYFDNEIGAKREPKRISSNEVTDKAEAWLAKQPEDKPWFLWLHYLDPHGDYVAHPGETQFGGGDEDRYDGEIAYTDKHFGRLLDFLWRSPHGKKTIIIVTADHGDGFNEHGYYAHGMTLYKELLHVPLLIYVPEIEPHTVDGPVSGLDILPTIADLVGVDISDVAVEGESLVPQLFYARDSKDRVVFAETNYPEPLRAAITNDYKLVYNLKANVYQLYNLRTDAWEKRNIWNADKTGTTKMKELLDGWLDRVLFSRAATSEAEEKRARILLDKPPNPTSPVDALFDGAIQLLGWDSGVKEVVPGQPLTVTAYFKVTAPPPRNLRFELEARGGGMPSGPRQEIIPVEGLYPTSRWRPGELLKIDFGLKIPAAWQAGPVALRLRLLDDSHQPAPVTGPAAGEASTAQLGSLPLVVATAPPK